MNDERSHDFDPDTYLCRRCGHTKEQFYRYGMPCRDVRVVTDSEPDEHLTPATVVLAGRLCRECDGRGWIPVGVAEFPCECNACGGTGRVSADRP